jgi:hypothetical protein
LDDRWACSPTAARPAGHVSQAEDRRAFHLIDRWAAFTDDELRVLERSLDDAESHADIDYPLVAVESLSDEIGAEIQRRQVAE